MNEITIRDSFLSYYIQKYETLLLRLHKSLIIIGNKISFYKYLSINVNIGNETCTSFVNISILCFISLITKNVLNSITGKLICTYESVIPKKSQVVVNRKTQ